MKKILAGTALVAALTGGAWVAAQTAPAPSQKQRSSKGTMMGGDDTAGPGMMGGSDYGPGMMGRGSYGPGMMGGYGMGMMGGYGPGMMGGGMCSMMMGDTNIKIDVKKIDKGVAITWTTSDRATAVRLQKMAEAMRLMHEAAATP